MSLPRVFVNEEEQALAEKNPELFKHYIALATALATKLSFEQWLRNREKMMKIIHSLSENFCNCSYYEEDCTEKCEVIFRQKFVQITSQISSITDEQLQFYDLMTHKSEVDYRKKFSAPLASRYLLDSRYRNL